MHLVIYGPEGSGKGTQAKLLSQKYHLPIYTSGDLVREAAQNDQGLIGQASRLALKEGRYVPDSEMFVLWKNKLKSTQAQKGFILDGFPRNVRQAQFLMEKLEKYGYSIDKVIYLDLPDEVAILRLSKRGRKLFSGSTINHDAPERVRQRLKVYRKSEKELLHYFKGKSLLQKVDADGSVEEVFKRIVGGLENRR